MGLSFPGTGAQFTKLWTNTKPDEFFGKQDILLDLSIYDAVYISIRSGNSTLVMVGGNTCDVTMNAWANGPLGAAFSIHVRTFTVKTDRVSVSDTAFVDGDSSGAATNNGWSVPVAIYGVNFGG